MRNPFRRRHTIVLRSATSGRLIAKLVVSGDELRQLKQAAAAKKMSMDEFIILAIENFVKKA